MIKRRTANKTEVGEKRKNEGLPNSKKKSNFSKSDPKNRKSRGKGETKWCEK